MFDVHKIPQIENIGSISICLFSRQFISAKIYPNKLAALKHDHGDVLILKRLRCNVVNDLTWFINLEALSQPEVFF